MFELTKIHRQDVEVKKMPTVKNVDGKNIEIKNAEWDKMPNRKKGRQGHKVEENKRQPGQ
jgi:hypothetical protein